MLIKKKLKERLKETHKGMEQITYRLLLQIFGFYTINKILSFMFYKN
jgi:hypothetical protein